MVVLPPPPLPEREDPGEELRSPGARAIYQMFCQSVWTPAQALEARSGTHARIAPARASEGWACARFCVTARAFQRQLVS